MIPKTTQTDAEKTAKKLELVEEESRPTAQVRAHSRLRPELRQAAEASWVWNEEAYRYLGR